ncbi:class I SAM-dependent DNA methyltransferase [Metallibacterium sp.]
MQFENYKFYLNWKTWSKEQFGVFSAKESATFALELRKAQIVVTSDSSILEVGFGNGAFAGWVRQKTRRYVGTELSSELVKRAIEAGIESYPATCNLADVAAGRKFDLIVMFDVLEHLDLEEITQTLTSARHCLSNNGKIIFRVPSGDSPFSGHLMHGDITHRTALGSYAIRQLAEITNLQVLSIHDTAFPILGMGFSVALRRTAVSIARKLAETAIRATYYANENVVISSTLVAVLCVRN